MLTVGSGGGGAGGTGSLTLQVAPEDLYQQAHDFDRAANIVQQAIMDNEMSLRVEPAGADVVSHAAAEWFTNSAFDSSTGALAATGCDGTELPGRRAGDASGGQGVRTDGYHQCSTLGRNQRVRTVPVVATFVLAAASVLAGCSNGSVAGSPVPSATASARSGLPTTPASSWAIRPCPHVRQN